MDTNLTSTVKEFLGFLNEECDYLERVKLLMVRIPELISNGGITQMEFHDFLETFEIETSRYLNEKSKYKETLAGLLKTTTGDITFKLLVALGFPEFEETGRRVLRLGNEIKLLMLKITIFQNNFNKLQSGFKRLNNFLYQSDYSPRGSEPRYAPGRNFYMEA